MRTVIIYKNPSEHARPVEEFMRELKQQTGKTVEEIDPDSKDGAGFCRAYDIMQYPTVIALDDEGKMLGTWSGLPLPTVSEIAYYA